MWKQLIMLTIIFFLSGCNKPEPAYKYIEKPIPRFKILNKIEFYKIEDYKSYDKIYWLINKEEFKIASDRVVKKDYKIRFYEKWGIYYNRTFATKKEAK